MVISGLGANEGGLGGGGVVRGYVENVLDDDVIRCILQSGS